MMTMTKKTVCVILAGGSGSRMASSERHKVCFPIAGVPAIVRAVNTYKEAGLEHFLVVVGQMAEQVIATVTSLHPEITFAYQAEQRGTGHAALVAAEALASEGFHGQVMIVMGDKVVQPQVVRDVVDRFEKRRSDALLTSLPKAEGSSAGRLVNGPNQTILGVVEAADIRNAAAAGRELQLAGRCFTAAEIEKRSSTVNGSLYMFRFDKLHEALRHLSPSNVQGELYLTDTVEYIARSGQVDTLLVENPENLMAFNTPAELLSIEQIVRRREGIPLIETNPAEVLSPEQLKPARQWLAQLESFDAAAESRFRKLYGSDEVVLQRRRAAMSELVQAFIAQFGPDRNIIICRAPGRINLMGRHVDHRGGFVNVMAVDREVLLVAAPREDDLVRLRHVEVQQFPNREFRIYDLLRDESWSDWMDFLASTTVKRVLDTAPGDWSHYARAPLLRLQYEHPNTRLKGMDCMVSGDIPMGAGLSSSSALVVAFAATLVNLNGLDVTTRDFVDLCGEGEWFVGSRGGSADHAAIHTGQLGQISRIGFFPFRVENGVTFPENLRFVIAHSGSQAVKSAGARDVFNQRVASYEFAEMLLKQRWPAAAGMQHLRDLTPRNLRVQPAAIYAGLLQLPQRPTRQQLKEYLPERCHDRMQQIFATHANLGSYDLRGAALFGISECIRSEEFAGIIADHDLLSIGQFMRASHDGDRRYRFNKDGECRRFTLKTDDGTLARAADENIDLRLQSGRYACSTEAIDQMVDIATATEGVVGAQLAGAGLGGCMMILVQADNLHRLLANLQKKFYKPRDLAENVYVCTPVAGAGLLSLAN